MIQTISPYATAKTAEIMSRYRPIAPKPQDPTGNTETDPNPGMPQSLKKSAYLRNVWAHLQARPTRTRKRGRSAAFAPPPVKRSRSCLQGLSQPFQATNSPVKNIAMHGFVQMRNGIRPQISLVPIKCHSLDKAVTTLAETVAALPILNGIDLNTTAGNQVVPLREFDFMSQLKEPVKPIVISPQPIRPIGSKITVENITDISDLSEISVIKGAEDVEKEVEAEEVPAIVSDSNNRVRLTNSAYKEMVGEPECCWLEAACGAAWRRIGGEVVLRFGDSEMEMSMHGFNCTVKIEWENNGKKSVMEASCCSEKLSCEAKDYQFLWRFHAIGEARRIYL